jgi:hypothetical protein
MVVDEVEDYGQHRRFDLTHVQGGVLFADGLVEPAQTPPQRGVEVILDIVVSPASVQLYLPFNRREISFQRLPNSRCDSNSNSYSS